MLTAQPRRLAVVRKPDWGLGQMTCSRAVWPIALTALASCKTATSALRVAGVRQGRRVAEAGPDDARQHFLTAAAAVTASESSAAA